MQKNKEIYSAEGHIHEKRFQAENVSKKIIQLEKEKEKYGINAA